VALLLSTTVWALPQGGSVVAGSSTITQSSSTTMNITQTTDKSIINWQSYSIAANEKVQYFQPSSSSISLNRVTGVDPSYIYGQLLANGSVWVINPNGLLVGNGANINVGSFVASTLNIGNEDFMAGNYKFRQEAILNGLPAITNLGNIKTNDGGYVVLISPSITNEGTITTNLGKTYLASGDEVTLNFAGNDLIGFTVDKGILENAAGITNKGTITANAGEVILSAKSASDVMKSVINNQGVIEAKTIEKKNGRILLLGGMENNSIKVGGTLDASALDGGDGGFIETSAAKVKVQDDAQVKAGHWLIDPNDFTIAASGGDITGAALGTALGAGNVTIQTTSGSASCTGATCGSGTAGNGDIFVRDNVTWSSGKTLTLSAYRNIEILATLDASGGSGGKVALEYGQGAVASGNTATYSFGLTGSGFTGKINLQAGQNFSTKLGSDGAPVNYTVITNLGNEGSDTGLDLQGMNGNLSGKYALGSDIDASATSGWNDDGSGNKQGFLPVGNSSTRFTGVFDGLGHTITGLTINRPSTDFIGLFGSANNAAIIRNVGLKDGSVSGNNAVGGLVGRNYGTITDSYNTGAVSGNYYVGGLVGDNRGTITDSYNTGAVSGNYDVGGLVGDNRGTITDSYNTGAVSGEEEVGGLAGYNGSYGTITNSYNTGAVSGNYDVGGLVGLNYGTITNSYNTGEVTGTGDYVGGLVGLNDGTITNSYNTGAVSGNYDVGGLVGYNYGTITNSYNTGAVSGSSYVGGLVGENDGTITSSYWDTETSGKSNCTGLGSDTGCTGLTTAQMKNRDNFSGWDFTEIWNIDTGGAISYPYLRSNEQNPHPGYEQVVSVSVGSESSNSSESSRQAAQEVAAIETTAEQSGNNPEPEPGNTITIAQVLAASELERFFTTTTFFENAIFAEQPVIGGDDKDKKRNIHQCEE
jgi:filamentous hemagglutinin family protein